MKVIDVRDGEVLVAVAAEVAHGHRGELVGDQADLEGDGTLEGAVAVEVGHRHGHRRRAGAENERGGEAEEGAGFQLLDRRGAPP
jgi:hypothetical protein